MEGRTTMIRPAPWPLYDTEKVARWLEKMARQGFVLTEHGFPGTLPLAIFQKKSSTDFLIILAPLRKCRNCLEYQAFPAFCVSEDTPHIMAYRSLIWRSKVVKP